MARELGLNPKKFGKLANHNQEPWKMPLPGFIRHLYFKHYGKQRPDVVVPIEERARQIAAKKAAKRAAKLERKSRHQTEDGQRTTLPDQNPKDES